MKPGKLYIVKKTLTTALYNSETDPVLGVSFGRYDTFEIPVGKIFLFICSFQLDGHLQSYCKLLYKDKVYITNNVYFIKSFVDEYKK